MIEGASTRSVENGKWSDEMGSGARKQERDAAHVQKFAKPFSPYKKEIGKPDLFCKKYLRLCEGSARREIL